VLLLTEVSYDHKKSEATKQAAKKAEILAIETYKKTRSQKLIQTQASQLYFSNARNTLDCGQSHYSSCIIFSQIPIEFGPT